MWFSGLGFAYCGLMLLVFVCLVLIWIVIVWLFNSVDFPSSLIVLVTWLH